MSNWKWKLSGNLQFGQYAVAKMMIESLEHKFKDPPAAEGLAYYAAGKIGTNQCLERGVPTKGAFYGCLTTLRLVKVDHHVI